MTIPGVSHKIYVSKNKKQKQVWNIRLIESVIIVRVFLMKYDDSSANYNWNDVWKDKNTKSYANNEIFIPVRTQDVIIMGNSTKMCIWCVLAQ